MMNVYYSSFLTYELTIREKKFREENELDPSINQRSSQTHSLLSCRDSLYKLATGRGMEIFFQGYGGYKLE